MARKFKIDRTYTHFVADADGRIESAWHSLDDAKEMRHEHANPAALRVQTARAYRLRFKRDPFDSSNWRTTDDSTLDMDEVERLDAFAFGTSTGRSNADTAFDQQHEYVDLDDALASYEANALDTVCEHYAMQSSREVAKDAAIVAFRKRVVELQVEQEASQAATRIARAAVAKVNADSRDLDEAFSAYYYEAADAIAALVEGKADGVRREAQRALDREFNAARNLRAAREERALAASRCTCDDDCACDCACDKALVVQVLNKATMAGDWDMVETCERALRGDRKALVECFSVDLDDDLDEGIVGNFDDVDDDELPTAMQVEQLANEAAVAGDLEMVETCTRALQGDREALVGCFYVIEGKLQRALDDARA